MKNSGHPNFPADGKTNIAWQLLDVQACEIILVDITGNILFANKAAIQNRLNNNEVIGTLFWQFVPITQKPQFKLVFNQVLSSCLPQTLKYQNGDRWFQTQIHPFLADDNQVESVGFFTNDITRITTTEEQLKKTILEVATAQEDERHRISRDLHDEIGQRMTALLLQFRSMKEIIKSDQKVHLEEINSASQNLEIIIKHLRQIFFQLYPPSLSRVSLPKVLEALCTSIEEAYGLEIDLSCQEEIPELLENQVATLYRLVQEGLTNVVKHSQATSAWINLDCSEGHVNISLEDNGIGFSVQDSVEGIGLRGLRERFTMLNGNFEIETALSKGTRLSGSIPIRIKM